jgi:ABC-type multidrug transport system ATPase subunit
MNIELINYSLRFGDKVIIKESSCLFKEGLSLLLGRNGSGKTSILKSFPLLINNWDGKVLVNGINLYNTNMRLDFGFQFEVDFLSNNLFPVEMLKIAGKLQNIKNLAVHIEYLLDFFEIDSKTEIQFLSYGNKKKLLLALSMLNSPKGLILDEPFEGLDNRITQKIIKLIQSNTFNTIIISTNNLYLAQELNSFGVLINNSKELEQIDEFNIKYIKDNM